MKKFRFLSLAAAAALLTLGACSEDKLAVDDEMNSRPNLEDPKDAVFLEVTVDLPNAGNSRSFTDNPNDDTSTSNSGVEVGQNYENSVNDVIVVLASKNNYNFIAAASVNAGDLSTTSPNFSQYKVLSKFSKTQLQNYYTTVNEDGILEDPTASVFVFCNPTIEVYNAIFGTGIGGNNGAVQGKNDWVNAAGKVTASSPIWAENNFLMSNSSIAHRLLPAKLSDWDYFTTEETAFDLSGANEAGTTQIDNSNKNGGGVNPVRVERAVARFDFRDGSEDKLDGNGMGNFTYHVYDIQEKEADAAEPVTKHVLNIQLQKMSLVNMNNDYFFLRHVSADGLLAGSQICKPETPWIYQNGILDMSKPGNFVVDADQEWKTQTIAAWGAKDKPADTKFAEHFIYPLFNDDGTIDNTNLINDRWGTSVMASVVNRGTDNNTEGWKNDHKDYKIWRYTTENTIAGIEDQCNGVSTGVVFKGWLTVEEGAAENVKDENTKDVIETIRKAHAGELKRDDPYANPILYYFGGTLYSTWTNLEKAAIEAAAPSYTWVPANIGDDGVVTKGHYELGSINRSNSVYKAVFGEGGFGEIKVSLAEYNEDTNAPTGEMKVYTITDTKAQDANSANASWHAWDKANKPSSGDLKEAFKKNVAGAGISIYQTSVDPSYGVGYYCYYYYWNRHNDNLNNGVMGPMEFATVRNNVYKLAITKVSRLGHPRISENDPNPPTPNTPDESEDVYLTVTTEVLPWVVRVNNIEF